MDCICGSIQNRELDEGNLGHPFQAIVFYLYQQGKKKVYPHAHTHTYRIPRKKLHSYFTKKGLSKVILSIPQPLVACQWQFLTHAISDIKKPTYACIYIRLSRRKGGVSLCLPYHLLHLAEGNGKTRHQYSNCPWSRQHSRRAKSL